MCGRDALRLVAWPVIALACAGALQADDRAADVARIHLEAIGGRARVDALRALRATGFVDTASTRVRFTLVAARPDRIRLETENKGRTLVQGSDGMEPPWEFDTGSWPPRYRSMAEGPARTFAADAEFDDPLVAGKERGFELEYAGESEAEGRKLLRLFVTRGKIEAYSLFLDTETYLVVRRVEKRSSGGRTVQITTRYDEFRPVEGVLLPHEITTIVDGRITQQTKIDQIVANPPLTAETFSRPKAASE